MKITVVTPSFNQGQFIERTIQSVLTQSISSLEYYVEDGASTDNTVNILKKYSDQLFCSSEKDTGQANAINKGFKKATGDIIGWLNSDDLYYPNTLSTVISFFEKYNEIDFLYGQANHIDSDDKVINQYRTEPWDLKRLTQRCYLSQPAVFFRRRVFDKIGYLDESLRYCMDYEYWLRAGTQGLTFFYLPTLLAATRLHKDAKTVRQSVAAHREQLKMILKYRPHPSLRMWAAYLYARATDWVR